MMPKIGPASYPDTLAKLKTDTPLLRAFGQFAADASDKNIRNYVHYCTGKFKIPQRYQMFHGPNASAKIPMGPGLQKQLDKLAESKSRENQSEMKKIHNTMLASCETVLNKKSLPQFYKSDAFLKYHRKALTGHEAKGPWLVQASKALKLTKIKSLAVLEPLLDAHLFENAGKVKAQADKLSKTGKLGSWGPSRDVVKELKKANLFR